MASTRRCVRFSSSHGRFGSVKVGAQLALFKDLFEEPGASLRLWRRIDHMRDCTSGATVQGLTHIGEGTFAIQSAMGILDILVEHRAQLESHACCRYNDFVRPSPSPHRLAHVCCIRLAPGLAARNLRHTSLRLRTWSGGCFHIRGPLPVLGHTFALGALRSQVLSQPLLIRVTGRGRYPSWRCPHLVLREANDLPQDIAIVIGVRLVCRNSVLVTRKPGQHPEYVLSTG